MAGRPTKYKDEYAEQAYKLCLLLSATDADLAKYFDVEEKTINNWKEAHPEFLQSLNEGKTGADQKVAQSLYQTALEGNTTAQIFWLKNRQKRQWRDKQEVDVQSSDGSMSPQRIEIVAPNEKDK